MKIDVILMHDQNLLRNLFYNISVLLLMTKHQGMIQDQMVIQTDIVVEVHLVITSTEITILNIDKDLHLELGIFMTEILLLHTTLDHVMIIIKEILAHTVRYTGLPIDHHSHVIHVLDTNPALTPEEITSKNTLLHIDLLQDLEIPDILDLVHTLIHEIKSIIFNHNLLLIQSTLKYTCIIQQEWQMH